MKQPLLRTESCLGKKDLSWAGFLGFAVAVLSLIGAIYFLAVEMNSDIFELNCDIWHQLGDCCIA